MENLNYTKIQYPEFAGHDKWSASLSAFRALSNMISELDSKNLVTEEEKKQLLSILTQIYLERKANAYLSAKLGSMIKAIGQLATYR